MERCKTQEWIMSIINDAIPLFETRQSLRATYLYSSARHLLINHINEYLNFDDITTIIKKTKFHKAFIKKNKSEYYFKS